jgi:hypothetical protein
MVRKVKLGLDPTEKPYNIYTGLTQDEIVDLVCSNITDGCNFEYPNTFTEEYVWVKCTTPGCPDQIFELYIGQPDCIVDVVFTELEQNCDLAGNVVFTTVSEKNNYYTVTDCCGTIVGKPSSKVIVIPSSININNGDVVNGRDGLCYEITGESNLTKEDILWGGDQYNSGKGDCQKCLDTYELTCGGTGLAKSLAYSPDFTGKCPDTNAETYYVSPDCSTIVEGCIFYLDQNLDTPFVGESKTHYFVTEFGDLYTYDEVDGVTNISVCEF